MGVEVRIPQMGESVVEAVIGSWQKKVGDRVEVGDILVELETDKVNQELPAETAGVLTEIVKPEGETVAIGDVIAIIGAASEAAAPAAAQPAAAPMAAAAVSTTPGDAQRAPSPLARRIAAEHNLDLNEVKGSSAHGRVTKDDVISHLAAAQQPAAPVAAPAAPVAPKPAAAPVAPVVVDASREERVRLSRRRQVIAQRLVQAQQTAAMLTTFNEVDMTAVMDIRKRRKDSFKEKNGVNLGFMSFFTKAVIGALKFQPRLNAEIQGNEMVLKKYYDIGIAVGADEGLVVPVVRDADRKSFAEIEREISTLAKKARSNELTLAELQGGTFTITNGGIFGSLMSTPILNAPQVGILGMHKIQERPMVVNGEIKVRPMMYLALSYDHRIVDGSEAVRFLVRVKELLEDPEQLLLEG